MSDIGPQKQPATVRQIMAQTKQVEREMSDQPLVDWLKTFTTQPWKREPHKFIVDRIEGSEFYLVLDTTLCEDDPKTNTCDVLIYRVASSDPDAEAIRLKADCNKYDVMRIIAAIGVSRFQPVVKAAFYATTSVLREGAVG